MDWVSFCNTYTWKIKDDQLTNDLLKKIREWWNQFECNIFPGPQPISIERSHFKQLKSNPYWVCAKTDGVRYIFVCIYLDDKPFCCLINRKKDVYLLKLEINQDAYKGTVLDGELVMTKDNQYEYLVYDSTIVCGDSCTSDIHSVRMNKALSIVDYIKQNNTKPCMQISIKTFYPLDKMKEYVQYMLPTLNHDIDGYIFTPENDPVRSGTHPTMFKWKEQMKNTVDFMVIMVNAKHPTGIHNPKYIMKIAKGKQQIVLHDQRVHIRENKMKQLLQKENRIIECKYISEGLWEGLFVRTDKIHPNNMLTYKKTLVNISENIKLEEFM